MQQQAARAAPWREVLLRALKKNSRCRHSRYMQVPPTRRRRLTTPPLARSQHHAPGPPTPRPPLLQVATVTPSGRPANRTVVFRGFLAGTDALTFVTDARCGAPAVCCVCGVRVQRGRTCRNGTTHQKTLAATRPHTSHPPLVMQEQQGWRHCAQSLGRGGLVPARYPRAVPPGRPPHAGGWQRQRRHGAAGGACDSTCIAT